MEKPRGFFISHSCDKYFSMQERDGEDSFLTTRQFKITDNEISTEEFKRSEGQLNQDPGNLECLKESEIRQVSSNAHVEDMNGVNSCNFETSKGEGFLELPGPPKVADDEACGLVHCQTDEINQSEISENLKHPQAGQQQEAVEDTRREYFEVMGEKNKSAGEKKVHHVLNATENMLQIEYTGELGLVVEKEENTKNDIGLDEYVEFNTDQKIFNKEIQLCIQKETSDLEKDKKGASIEDKHSDLSSNQVLSVTETTLEQKNEALVHIPKFTVCDLGMGIQSVAQGCAKEENTDNFSIAHAALEPGKERSSEGINSKKAERSFDFVGGKECLKAIGCREDKITKKDDNEKITDHSTKDGSILTKAASQDTQTGEEVTFKGEDTVDEQLEKKPAIDGLDISIEEEVAIVGEKKHTDAPATVYNEKSQDTTESSKQLNSHLAQNEVQDKDSSDTLSITDIEDKCSLQVDNPQMPQIYPGTTSELDALEKYVHKKGQELETMEALAEEAIHKEASISPVTSKDNEMDAEKLTREESNTEAIEEHDNGLLLVSVQDGATKTSNDEENDAEKPHKVVGFYHKFQSYMVYLEIYSLHICLTIETYPSCRL